MDALQKVRTEALSQVYQKNTFTVLGAIVVLKMMNDAASRLIWNSIHYWLDKGILIDFDQLQRKFEASNGADYNFWCITTEEVLINTSWSNPKSFYAIDREAAVDYADKVLNLSVA